ncbi:DinB family protein [Chitinophaga caseinilytica]|uniref:DinB family protein n=1 Tax=Chitinophaga caseinilytica TaxID=2267521 RepID=A0ABZ2YZC2_9BACT
MSLPVVLSEALQHIYQGQPWLDVTFMEHLRELDAAQASRRFDTSHNIWELVNHIIFWHQNVDRKLKGEKPEQEGDLPDFYFPENHGENNWQATLQRLDHSITHMAETIRNFPEEKLYSNVANTQHNAYYYIQGVLQHAAYHLGQIVLIRKYAENE